MILDFIGTKEKEVKIDLEILLRVVDNLISNAKSYSKKGTIINTTVRVLDGKLKINIVNEVEKEW